jgi:hypothetical protein
MNVLFLVILTILSCKSWSFVNHFEFGKKFCIKNNEIIKPIKYNLPVEKQDLVNKINGVYALIGPDIDINKVSTLFDLFVGDGIIQSVFFENGELTYSRNYIRTEKLLLEERIGKIPKNIGYYLLFGILNKMKLFPNFLGLANTAILKIKDETYALYERDMPYLIKFDFLQKKVNTIRKVIVPDMTYFSAHSQYNPMTKTIDTIEYDMMTNHVHYNQLTNYFTLLKTKSIIMEYLPIVHDFLKTEYKIVVVDSPLIIDFKNLLKKKVPVILDNKKKTIINVLDKRTLHINRYYVNEGFYIFHYADYKEDDKVIEMYASLYNTLDFSDLNITGKYRKIIINKETRVVEIIKNAELEELDLEFPVKFENKVILRSNENRRTNGFVICQELTIIKKLIFSDKFFAGEPAVHYIENKPYLISFAFDENYEKKSFLIIINLTTYETIEIPINESLTLGFHSQFINP